jgi:hypothetical protein
LNYRDGVCASWHERAEELRTAADDMFRRYQHVDLSKTSREAIRELYKLAIRCADQYEAMVGSTERINASQRLLNDNQRALNGSLYLRANKILVNR